MNQILNLLSFLMELVFGRDASMRRSRSQTVRSLIVIAILAVSLFTNYYVFKSLYSATAKYIAIKEQLTEYEKMKERVTYLELHNQALQRVMDSLAPNMFVPSPAPLPSKPAIPNPVLSTPAPPPRDEHPAPLKEQEVTD